MRPRRAPPEGFREWYERHRSMRRAMRLFRASRRVVRGWVTELGLKVYDQRTDQVEQRGRQRPENFVALAGSFTSVDDARLKLRTHRNAVLRFYREAGLPPPPVRGFRRTPLRHLDPPRSAITFLRTHHGADAHDFGETYAAMTGGRYVVGRRRMTEEQLLELARVYGWRG